MNVDLCRFPSPGKLGELRISFSERVNGVECHPADKRTGKLVVVEGKGGGGKLIMTKSGTNTEDVQQMSQDWIKYKIKELFDEGASDSSKAFLTDLANELQGQVANQELQAMVVVTKIAKDGIQAPQYLLKDWKEIGQKWFDTTLMNKI